MIPSSYEGVDREVKRGSGLQLGHSNRREPRTENREMAGELRKRKTRGPAEAGTG